MFAEMIYETGSKSVGCYADEAEVLAAAKAHHDRAKNGESGSDAGNPAERIVRIELYDKHPNDLPEPSAEVVAEEMKKLKVTSDDTVMTLAAKVRDLASPVVLDPDAKRHDSLYKMEATKVLTEGWDN
jgi:hypothetical protein